jgi:fatty acid desaturase
MGWHDALAVKMAEAGRTSAEFRAGARRKAGVTLLLLAGAGAVGYFLGWAWALLPGVAAIWPAFQSVSATLVASRLEAMEARSRPGQASS